MIHQIASLGPIGHAPVAPGTLASAAAIPLAYGLHILGGFPLLLIATGGVAFLGWHATRVLTADGPADPSWIVIDEVAGQWVALWPLSAGLWAVGAAPTLFPWPGWVGAFVLFRLFDILKPGPVGWADRKGTPGAVMLDDLIAGALAALCVAAAAAFAHGLFL